MADNVVNSFNNLPEDYNRPDVIESTPHISKNQLKRQRKIDRFKAMKLLKKELKKSKKSNQKTISQCPEGGKTVRSADLSSNSMNEPILKGQTRQSKLDAVTEFSQKCALSFSVAIDCSFEDKHSDKDLKSLGQQIMFCYGFNKRHSHPVYIHLTGIKSSTYNTVELIHIHRSVKRF
jgi:Trm5-related predicted tRNA methylase